MSIELEFEINDVDRERGLVAIEPRDLPKPYGVALDMLNDFRRMAYGHEGIPSAIRGWALSQLQIYCPSHPQPESLSSCEACRVFDPTYAEKVAEKAAEAFEPEES